MTPGQRPGGNDPGGPRRPGGPDDPAGPRRPVGPPTTLGDSPMGRAGSPGPPRGARPPRPRASPSPGSAPPPPSASRPPGRPASPGSGHGGPGRPPGRPASPGSGGLSRVVIAPGFFSVANFFQAPYGGSPQRGGVDWVRDAPHLPVEAQDDASASIQPTSGALHSPSPSNTGGKQAAQEPRNAQGPAAGGLCWGTSPDGAFGEAFGVSEVLNSLRNRLRGSLWLVPPRAFTRGRKHVELDFTSLHFCALPNIP